MNNNNGLLVGKAHVKNWSNDVNSGDLMITWLVK